MNSRISFIIPVYNAENFIEKCISSIFSQGMSPSDYEIIAINDGSTDNSLNLLQKLAKEIENLKIIDSFNRGAGSARNIGIKAAMFETIVFVDADDFLFENVFCQFVELYDQYELDILGFETLSVRGKQTLISESLSEGYDEIYNGEDFILKYNGGYGPCAKLIKKDLFIKNNLYFPEGIVPEDIELMPKLILAADRIMYVPIIGYNYVYNEQSVTKKRSKDSYVNRIQGLLYVTISLNTFSACYLNKNPKVYEFLNHVIILKCIKELFYFIDIRAPFDIIQLRSIHSQLRKKNVLPLQLIGIKDFYLFNFYTFHVISYCLRISKLIHLSNNVYRKLINWISQ